MKRLIIILGLIMMPLLVGCKKDPETEDLKNYIQVQLFPIRTNLRAATTQYEKSASQNELARSGVIRTKVLYQLRKYRDGLEAIETKTGFTELLNDEGIERVNQRNIRLYERGELAGHDRDFFLTDSTRKEG